jgi:LPS-assembly lipoprotein
MWWFRTGLALPTFVAGLALAGCGFHLRGESALPFDTLTVQMANPSSPMATELKRAIAAGSKTRIVDNANEAQAILQVVGEQNEKVILSLSSAGRVSAYTLRYRFVFRVHDGKGHDFIPQNEIVLVREMTYSDAQVLAKEVEEKTLYRDMQHDMALQVMRRLAAAKPEKAAGAT